MEKIKVGDIVSVNYIGRLDNQVIFDSTDIRGPLHFKVGDYQLIPKFEEAVIGMEKGESKKIYIKSSDAYGDYDERLVFKIDKNLFPKDMDIRIGDTVQLREENGEFGYAIIQDIIDDKVILNANHPLAGQNLTFEITIVGINNISEKELYTSCDCGCNNDSEKDCDCC